VVSQAREKHPMMPLTLYRSTTFSGANLLTLALYFGLTGALFFLPFELIARHGYSAAKAPGRPCCRFRWSWAACRASRGGWPTGSGPGPMLTVGPILAGIGFGLLGAPWIGKGFWTGVLPGLLVVALGMTIASRP
jgi:hypothetical protein